MFVSGNAVNGFMMARPIAAAGQMGSPIRTRAWATGPGTRQVLIKNGWPANLIDAPPQEAAQFDSEALWSGVSGQVRPGGKVLVIRGETYPSSTAQSAIQASNSGRDWLVNKIIEAGATPLVFASYWRCAPVMTSEQLNQIEVAASSGALWLFSSSEAIANLMALVPSQKWSGARAVATHPRIAARAQAAGFGRVKLARPTVKDVLASIESLP